jgi:hypothetical protein
MPTVTANWNAKGVITSGTPGGPLYPLPDWPSTRNANDGLVYQTVMTHSPQIGQVVLSGRGGVSYRIGRVFGWVDVTAYAPNITAIDLNIPWGTSTGINDFIICQSFGFSNGSSTTLVGPDMDINGSWDVGNPFCAQQTYVQSSTQTVTLNAQGIAAANSLGNCNFIIIDYDYDYQNLDPALGGLPANFYGRFNYSVAATADITYSLPGYANDPNNVTGANIKQMNGVSGSDIDKISGI